MLQKISILSLFIIGALTAPNPRPGRVCGNRPPEVLLSDTVDHLANKPSVLPADLIGAQRFQNVTIPVHWHVLMGGNSPSQGNVTDKQIADSIDVMNESYSNTGFSFQLVNTTRTLNRKWFDDLVYKAPIEATVKGALRRGDAGALNIYTTNFKNVPADLEGLLGYATLPSEYKKAPNLDGVVIQYQTLPGGIRAPYNLGLTLVHETGHWFELYHTFNEGRYEFTCKGPGDMVDDTPMQQTYSSGCPINLDSCPGGGVDPVHNYMDYSDDACMNQFTPGQIARMQSFYSKFRAVPVV